jgi:hypothetical protein
MSKGGAVGVAQSPIAHARASIAKPYWTLARVSRFAKTSANIWNPFRAHFERAPIVKTGCGFNWSRADGLSSSRNSGPAAQFMIMTDRSRP